MGWQLRTTVLFYINYVSLIITPISLQTITEHSEVLEEQLEAYRGE